MKNYKLFRVTADYRKNNPNKPHYYILANNRKEAKIRFKNRISWLDIYNVEICNENDIKTILHNPMEYIVF